MAGMEGKTVSLDTAEHERLGSSLFQLVETLYPICRSITGNGVRETLSILQDMVPLQVHEVASGTQVFDWTVPDEWNVREAWIKNSKGDVIVDFAEHNLHLLNYSVPQRQILSLEQLRPHLYSLTEQPDLIPYKTSYYNKNWGFCLAHNRLENLPEDQYEVFIDSTLTPGHLTYGELLIPGRTEEEILFTAHVCHPSLANDNLSGISVLTHLASRLLERENRYSYRFLWIPGTIGSITWLALNTEVVPRIKCGLVASLLGDEGDFTYKKTRRSSAELDYLVPYALEQSGYPFSIIDFSPYGYDERQFCSPGFDLAVGSLTRSVFASFPEYHTSADNLDFVHEKSLLESLDIYARIVELLEYSEYFVSHVPHCEPQLGKRGLYAAIGGKRDDVDATMAMLWLLNSADGRQSLFTIAQKSGIPLDTLREVVDTLIQSRLISRT